MKLTAWEIHDFAPGEVDPVDVVNGHAGDRWMAVAAPADTYLALHAAGRIPHPFEDQNEVACEWVGEREWWWRATFALAPASPGERLQLVFDGLDTYASIWLNGEYVGESRNMFHAVTIDISECVNGGSDNTLVLRFRPPSIIHADATAPDWAIGPGKISASKRNLTRKAQFVWGWDWGPRLLTVGIYKPVRVIRQRYAALSDIRFRTLSVAEKAEVDIAVAADSFAVTAPLTAIIELHDPMGHCVLAKNLPIAGRMHTTASIDNPQLWWTRELGAQPLYALDISLHHGGVEIDRQQLQVGIRTLSLDTGPNRAIEGQHYFRFVLNGVPIFARGVNWIPASSFVAALEDGDYAWLLQDAVDANMNMVRVWGGGIYEHDAFYDHCNRLGLLVWQDFMFACAPYPQSDRAFLDSIREEVAFQVKRLRNHPALALWCGNNENHFIQELVNHLLNIDLPLEGALIFEQLIPDVLRDLNESTPYWPGSPYGGKSANTMRMGDEHNWTVWHGMPPVHGDAIMGDIDRSIEGVAYTRFAEDSAAFVSEYGIQASPGVNTLSRWITDGSLALGSQSFLNRVKDEPKNKIDALMTPVTGLPSSLEQYVDFTQITQAEGLKFAIEHFRRRKPHCSGSLIWQYNDCWPGISWSLLDFDGVGKASYFFVKRAYAHVMASFKALDNGAVELWLSNDTLNEVAFEATVALMSLDGTSRWRESIHALVGANASVTVWRAGADRLGSGADRALCVRSAQCPANRHFFAAIKELPLRRGEPAMQIVRRDAHTLVVSVTGSIYHYLTQLMAAHPGTRFSDNYFELAADEIREIIVSHRVVPLDPSDISIRSFHH